MQANHNNHNNIQPSQTTRKSPSQTCVSSRETTNQTNERGRSPNKNNHQKDLPKDTVVWPLHHSQKHAKMNYDPRHSNKTRRPNSLPVNFGIDVPKLYMSTGLQLMPLSASSQISLSRRPPGTESLSYLCREQECRGGHCTRFPPVGGADGSGAQEASQASEKLPYSHRRSNSAGPLVS